MTVFKTFLHILNKCKGIIILYTVILVCFGGINIKTNDKNISFTENKPDMLVVNNDENTGVTADMIAYLKEHAVLKNIKDSEEARNDALFYRDVNYIVYIPQGFRSDILAGKCPEIEIETTGDYPASYAEMLVAKYVGTAQTYAEVSADENALIKNISETLGIETEVEITSKLDATAIAKAAAFYNFMNYGLLAGAIFTICTVLGSFNERNVRRRTNISCISTKKYNRILLLSNMLFALTLWALYVALSFATCGSGAIATKQGLIFILNSFIFTICTVTIAFLISNLTGSKNAINGIVNVVALGSSFLCGAFVPSEYLPDSVLNIAHILPSYWFINTNDRLRDLEKFDFGSLKPLFINMAVIIGFSVLFVILSNIISAKKKRSNQ
ncbi:MAG: ABC transporter permease [Clostridium sp.]|nr:ABC transporter permease [Clostridium sp.]MCM1548097.1 ABC transporter permease [Ruminococcus sp.]